MSVMPSKYEVLHKHFDKEWVVMIFWIFPYYDSTRTSLLNRDSNTASAKTLSSCISSMNEYHTSSWLQSGMTGVEGEHRTVEPRVLYTPSTWTSSKSSCSLSESRKKRFLLCSGILAVCIIDIYCPRPRFPRVVFYKLFSYVRKISQVVSESSSWT